MFTLIDVVAWVIAIGCAGAGIFCIFMTFTEENGWQKFCGILGIGLAIATFFVVYNWLESVCVALFVSGGILLAFSGGLKTSENKTTPSRNTNPGGGLVSTALDVYCEYELQKAATKDAIREMEKK